MISILYVDDEPEFLAQCRTFLEKNGDLKVTTARSGQEGLARLSEQPFAVVVSEYWMEGMNGIDFLQKVRDQYPRLPIIIFTRKRSEEKVSSAFSNGADCFVWKGSDPELQFRDLEDHIRKAARRSSHQHAVIEVESREVQRLQRSFEELQESYQQLHNTESALREKLRFLLHEQAVLKGTVEKYRKLVEADPDALLLIDGHLGTIIEANTSASHLYGYPRDEILGKNIRDLFNETDSEILEGNAALISGISLPAPVQKQRRKDNSIFFAEITSRKEMWGEQPVRIFQVRDVTSQQKVADARSERIERTVRFQKALVQLATEDASTLRASLHRITETGAALLSADRVGIWFFSRDGERLLCSDLYIAGSRTHAGEEAFYGRDHHFFLSLLHQKRAILAPDALDDSQTREFAATYLKPRQIISALYIPIRSGKTVIGMISYEQTVSFRDWEIEDQDFAGALADYTAIVLEQARRRLAEKDHLRSERKYHAVVERANDGIVIIQDGRLRFVNPRAAIIMGFAPEELLGSRFIEHVAVPERAIVLDRYHQRMTGEQTSIYNTVLLKKDGSPVDVEINAGLMELDGKTSDLVFIRDITDRKRSEQALLLANQKLNLLSSITRHDILNKLTVVIGYLELAKMTHNREELEDFIQKMDGTLQVVEDQVQFTRDYQDLGVKEPEWQDVSGAFDAAVSHLEPGSIRIQNKTRGLFLYADPLLGKVLYNIVDNALRYGGNLTEITAWYTADSNEAVLYLEDNGVGILAKDKTKIFEKGFGHNTGLGLFLAKEILSLTGIDIMETGFPTKGARFEIHVPAGKFRITR